MLTVLATITIGKFLLTAAIVVALMAFIFATAPYMAYAERELVGSVDTGTAQLRCFSYHTMPKTFAAGSGTLTQLTPLAINKSTKKWIVWSAAGARNAIETWSVDATGGTYTITPTVDGVSYGATGNIAYNATAETVTTALLALGDLLPGDVVVTGGVGAAGGGTPYVATMGGNLAGKTVTFATAVGSLTGGAGTATVTHTQTGQDTDADEIRGFVWPDQVTLDAADDVLGQVCLGGDIHFQDIPLPAGQTLDNLKAACRTLRTLGFRIQGLDKVE